jgi:hypothetical protein
MDGTFPLKDEFQWVAGLELESLVRWMLELKLDVWLVATLRLATLYATFFLTLFTLGRYVINDYFRYVQSSSTSSSLKSLSLSLEVNFK